MTAELRETVALASWGPVTVKKEEEENFAGQVPGQQMHSETISVWASGEGTQADLDTADPEGKVSDKKDKEEGQTNIGCFSRT